jgi:hypothetical protein
MKNYKKQFQTTLSLIFKEFPSLTIGQILDGAFAEYNNTYHLSEKETLYALDRFLSLKRLNEDIIPNDELEEIIRDASHLFDEEEED